MKKLKIREAKPDDIVSCSQIEADNFSEPWSYNSFSRALTDNNTMFFVVCVDNEVVGYYVASNICDEINLYTIAISSTFRKQGCGKLLLLHLIAMAKAANAINIGLEVRVSNERAIALYEQNGFVRNGLRRDFYKKPKEDAYLYTLYLNEDIQ